MFTVDSFIMPIGLNLHKDWKLPGSFLLSILPQNNTFLHLLTNEESLSSYLFCLQCYVPMIGFREDLKDRNQLKCSEKSNSLI